MKFYNRCKEQRVCFQFFLYNCRVSGPFLGFKKFDSVIKKDKFLKEVGNLSK